MCLVLSVHISHAMNLLKKPRKNQGFSKVRSFHATLELAVFALILAFRHANLNSLGDFEHKRIKMVLEALLRPLLGSSWEPLGRYFGACWASEVALGPTGIAKIRRALVAPGVLNDN